MKAVYSYQEIAVPIARGKQVACTCFPHARVTLVQKRPESDIVTATISIHVRDTCIGIIDTTFESILTVLEAFDIDDLAEVWEVLDEQGKGVDLWATQP